MHDSLFPIPELSAKCQTGRYQLEKYLLDHQVKIEGWLRQQWRKTPPPIYASVDLRNAGFKLAPVDTNLFPAGFNNLNPDCLSLCIQAAQTAFEGVIPGCLRILLVPESHTRNPFYFESLATLQDILVKAGFDVRIGSLLEDLQQANEIKLSSGRVLHLEPLQRDCKRVGVADFSPCLVLLNNDLATGIPPILQDIEQPILPSPSLGWANRLKSIHFHHYAEVAKEFSELVGIDPWLINPLFRSCEKVNFLQREGEGCLVTHTQDLLEAIQQKYSTYGITQKPYIVIKAEAGTYGMGVLVVHSAEEILTLNRKKRMSMAISKGNRPITQVILQEGVYTFETWQHAVAEPVVYMLGQHVIGGFYRVHTGRGITDNLNAPGMHFAPLAFADACNKPQPSDDPSASENRFYSYGVIARLALVAAAREQAAV